MIISFFSTFFTLKYPISASNLHQIGASNSSCCKLGGKFSSTKPVCNDSCKLENQNFSKLVCNSQKLVEIMNLLIKFLEANHEGTSVYHNNNKFKQFQ